MSSVEEHLDVRLTRGAIEAMIRGNGEWPNLPRSGFSRRSTKTLPIALPEMIVRTFPYMISIPTSDYGDQPFFVTESDDLYIYDGKYHVRAILLDKDCCLSDGEHNLKTSSMFIRIHGYITSQANLDQEEPVLFLTKIEILRSLPIANSKVFRSDRSIIGTQLHGDYKVRGDAFVLREDRVMGGKIVNFLSNVAPYLSCDALSGCQKEEPTPLALTPSGQTDSATNNHNETRNDNNAEGWIEMNRKLQVVANFLSKHHAYVTLMNSGDSSESESHVLPTPVVVHKGVMESFGASQMDLQKAALSSNLHRAQSSQSQQIVDQHQEVLQQIIDCKHPWLVPTTDDINLAMLNWCHARLCGGGLLPDAGTLRSKSVRVGTTSFVYKCSIENSVLKLLSSLETIRNRCFYQSYHRGQHSYGTIDQQQLLALLTYTAAVCMGILDTHPYSDGNGRLARLVVNWILYHQIRVPFVVHFFTTPSQRQEYSRAICRTRRNISLVPYGVSSDDFVFEAYERVGALYPMIELLLGRLYKAVVAFNGIFADKLNPPVEWTCGETDKRDSRRELTLARAARSFREQAASGTCQICFENKPNISTLCCGVSVHLNCIAQWLINHSSCPQCRFVIPQLPTVYVSESSDHDDGQNTSFDYNDTDSVVLDDTEVVDYDAVSVARERSTFCAHCAVNLAAVDCPNVLCGSCCGFAGRQSCARHGS